MNGLGEEFRGTLAWIGLLWVLALLLIPRTAALGDETFLPTLEHHKEAGRAADCALYRGVAARTRKEVAEARHLLGEITLLLRNKRTALESCGAEKGLTGSARGWDEAILAELCPEAYQDWLRSGYRHRAISEDIHESEAGLGLLSLQLRASCGVLPTALAAAGY